MREDGEEVNDWDWRGSVLRRAIPKGLEPGREVCSGAGGMTTILHSAEQQLGQFEPSYPLSCSFPD